MTKFEDTIIKSVKDFIRILCRNNQEIVSGIHYIDLVSVEVSEGKEYTVFWFGPDEKFLVSYENLITEYFKIDKSVSLLFIAINDRDSKSIHKEFHNENFQKLNLNRIQFNSKIIKKVFLDKSGHKIENRDVSFHQNQWLKKVLKPINAQHASFSKIKLEIGQSEYFAAIWIGYQLKQSQLNNNDSNIIFTENNENSRLIIEKFLLQHSLDVIANNQLTKIKDHATKSATSRIINRNYAHHIGSHVSHRATADKIYERVFGDYNLNFGQQVLSPSPITIEEMESKLIRFKVERNKFISDIKSIVEMENRLTRYKDERNEFISGIESNTHPVPVMFYKDVIQPFIENSLLMDNIAKSEGICWESVDPLKNDGKVKEDGISKLRIRVFYHKDILADKSMDFGCAYKDCCCAEHVPCLYKKGEHGVQDGRLSLDDLDIDSNWLEMMAVYNLEKNSKLAVNTEHNTTCIHRLPYYKKLLGKDGRFYNDAGYTLSDIEVAIPGTLGAQSIYSLLENHIRNTAKHAPSNTISSKMPVNIVIKIRKRKHENGADDADFFNLELTSNIPTIHKDEQKAAIEAAFKEPIDGDTRALGFADMRINATLLAFKEVKQENLDHCIQQVGYYPNQTVNGQSTAYCMKLTRPCKIIFVGKEYQRFKQEILINVGIRQYDSIKDCLEAMGDNPRAFEFAVVEKEVFDGSDNHDLFLKRLPWRVLVPSRSEKFSETLKALIHQRRVTLAEGLTIEDSDGAAAMLKKCWDAWLRNRWQAPYTLNMYFDNNEELDSRYGSSIAKLDENLAFRFQLGSKNSEVFKNAKGFDVFYDRHGGFRNKIIANLQKKSLLHLSWEQIDKNNPDFDLINNDKLSYPEISFSRLVESGIHKILIIDERAREAGLKIYQGSYVGEDDMRDEANPYIRFAMASRVFIADSFVLNGEEVLYGAGGEKGEHGSKFFQVELSSEDNRVSYRGGLNHRHGLDGSGIFFNFDTLIIHRSMMTKVKDPSLFKMLADSFPNIIITTGGGTLMFDDYILNRSKMLPFSSVQKYLLNGVIAKNCITNLI